MIAENNPPLYPARTDVVAAVAGAASPVVVSGAGFGCDGPALSVALASGRASLVSVAAGAAGCAAVSFGSAADVEAACAELVDVGFSVGEADTVGWPVLGGTAAGVAMPFAEEVAAGVTVSDDSETLPSCAGALGVASPAPDVFAEAGCPLAMLVGACNPSDVTSADACDTAEPTAVAAGGALGVGAAAAVAEDAGGAPPASAGEPPAPGPASPASSRTVVTSDRREGRFGAFSTPGDAFAPVSDGLVPPEGDAPAELDAAVAAPAVLSPLEPGVSGAVSISVGADAAFSSMGVAPLGASVGAVGG